MGLSPISEGRGGAVPEEGKLIMHACDVRLETHIPNTLARVYGAAAIGIVLSGIGSDGTLGLRAIRQRGGLTIAQDGQSAAVNGMPRSASESGAAAFILSPKGLTSSARSAAAREANRSTATTGTSSGYR